MKDARSGQGYWPLIFVLLSLTGGYTANVPTASIARDSSNAALHLAQSISTVLGHDKNTEVFSPVSVTYALLLLLLGIKDNTARQEVLRVLNLHAHGNHLDSVHNAFHNKVTALASTELHEESVLQNLLLDDRFEYDSWEPPTIDERRLTNAIFAQDGLPLSDAYIEAARTLYNCSLTHLPFATDPTQSALDINEWVKRSTNARIQDIVPVPLDRSTQMLVASALYFKGTWLKKLRTERRFFYPLGRDQRGKRVDMLTARGYFLYHNSTEYGAEILGLPYEGHQTMFYAIVPHNSNRTRLQQFQRSLKAETVDDMISKMSYNYADMQLPKLKLSNDIDLQVVLKQLGVRAIFDGNDDVFSGMFTKSHGEDEEPSDSNPALHVSDFLHKIELEVDEKGTEGSAVTFAIMRISGAGLISVDTPFLLLIVHKPTNLPLFYGSVYDPTIESVV